MLHGYITSSLLRGDLPAALSEEQDGQSPQHDFQIFGGRSPMHVFEVELELAAHIIEARVVAAVDLRQPRDAGRNALAVLVALDFHAQTGEDRGLLWSRADDVHLAAQHVQELGKLIEPVLAENSAHRRDPRIMRLGPDFLRAVAIAVVRRHRPKLVNRERHATMVVRSPIVSGGNAGLTAIETDPRLRVENRSARCELDQERDQRHQRRYDQQSGQRDGDIEHTAPGL